MCFKWPSFDLPDRPTSQNQPIVKIFICFFLPFSDEICYGGWYRNENDILQTISDFFRGDDESDLRSILRKKWGLWIKNGHLKPGKIPKFTYVQNYRMVDLLLAIFHQGNSLKVSKTFFIAVKKRGCEGLKVCDLWIYKRNGNILSGLSILSRK